jgi:hypothetical protein
MSSGLEFDRKFWDAPMPRCRANERPRNVYPEALRPADRKSTWGTNRTQLPRSPILAMNEWPIRPLALKNSTPSVLGGSADRRSYSGNGISVYLKAPRTFMTSRLAEKTTSTTRACHNWAIRTRIVAGVFQYSAALIREVRSGIIFVTMLIFKLSERRRLIRGGALHANRRNFTLTAMAIVAYGFGAQLAVADTFTNIDLTAYVNGNWSSEINGAAIQAGAESVTGSTGSGLSFSDPTGAYVDIAGFDPPLSITGLSIALNSNAVVNSLLNNFFGDSAGVVEGTLVFTNSLNQTASFSFEAGNTIRDYNNDGFQNGLNGTNSNPADGVVTAQDWWDTGDAGTTGNGEPTSRLDAQTFDLPASWGGTDLTSITLTDPLGNVGQDVLSAIQVDDHTVTSAVPEPSALMLLATGLAGLGFFGRRRRRTF